MFPPVFIQLDENPNTTPMDGLVFQPKSEARAVARVRVSRSGEPQWSRITGLDEDARPCDALAHLIDDSGDGACYLITGGAWGLRLQSADANLPWDVADASQWGEPYLLMGADGKDVEFGGACFSLP